MKRKCPKLDRVSSEEEILLPSKRDHATDEEEILTSANALFHVSNASSLPGNGAKNLTGQVLYLSKCTDHS